LERAARRRPGPEQEYQEEIPTVEAEIEGIDRGFACKPEKVRLGLKRKIPLKYKTKGSAKTPRTIETDSQFLLTEAPLPENFLQTAQIQEEEALKIQK